ncbi:hypothetical protein I8752_26205 [Nostocaceae cyanobacterium CENA369]|uniref:Uncharacterized protein n=1 Tax=Dendronalium phyllosphericum CENA369 TaxID=1725256 RepID=A0A8J7I624_9NOST|nr:hypothetical protein [Dendronalium phyllosphericum]MBH8576419.1 hypothetical protein [Dendronalium phyllosphericum CENA369]
MKRLASLVMALALGTAAVVAFPPDSQAQSRREDFYRTRDYRYGDRDRSYSPRRYYRGERRFPRLRRDRDRDYYRSPYRDRDRGRYYTPGYRY